MQTITRKENIQFFLHDYYFGYGKWITGLRLLGGPFLVLLGWMYFQQANDKVSVAYGGVCFLYGIYMLFRPYLWVLFRLDGYKTEQVELHITEEMLFIKGNKNQHEIALDTFKKIIEHKMYFTLIVSRSQRIRLPKRLLSESAQIALRKGVRSK